MKKRNSKARRVFWLWLSSILWAPVLAHLVWVGLFWVLHLFPHMPSHAAVKFIGMTIIVLAAITLAVKYIFRPEPPQPVTDSQKEMKRG